jgi:DNA-binding CsgD family transcriptional regulator/PAS domain-containing protein
MVFPTAAVLEIPEQLREVCMQPSRLKNSAGDAAGPFGAQRQRRQAWIDMIASGVLLCQVGAAPETPLRGKLSEISLDEESVEENVVTMQAMSRRAQSVAAEGRDTVALLVNTGAGKLCLAQRGRTADLAVGDAALRDNAKPWKLVGEPNYVCRALCIQVPRELVRPHVDDHAAVTIPAGSPALALARNYVEGLLSVGGFDDAGLARLALDHLADLVSAALTGTAGEIAAQSVDNSGSAPLRRPNDIAYPRSAFPLAALSRVDSHAMISAATLDVMAMPILVLDAEGHCIDTNAAADRLLATTRLIRISGGVLVIADQDASRQVAHAVRAAAAGADPVSTRVTVVALTLEESRRYAAEVIALPRAAPSDGIAALMLQEIGKLQPLPGDILVKLYGFTPAEARLVALLAQDFSLEDAAAALGIARTTAKTHLQRVFEKTGTNRQPQVVRLALSAFAAAPT